MPIYEYRCSSCEHAFEVLIRSEKDEKKVACPECGGRDVARRPSVFAAHGAPAKPALPPGGCCPCGDPNGPCSLQ